MALRVQRLAGTYPSPGCASKGPCEGQQIPRGDGDEVHAESHTDNSGRHSAPSSQWIDLKHLQFRYF